MTSHYGRKRAPPVLSTCGNVQWIQIAKGPGSLAANPALLSGAAGIMTQQAMDEITDYLAKIDDVLRGQKDAALTE